MNNLKPCPFCGSEARIVHKAKRKVMGDNRYEYGNKVYCTVCDAEIFSSQYMAVERWNRRFEG